MNELELINTAKRLGLVTQEVDIDSMNEQVKQIFLQGLKVAVLNTVKLKVSELESDINVEQEKLNAEIKVQFGSRFAYIDRLRHELHLHKQLLIELNGSSTNSSSSSSNKSSSKRQELLQLIKELQGQNIVNKREAIQYLLNKQYYASIGACNYFLNACVAKRWIEIDQPGNITYKI